MTRPDAGGQRAGGGGLGLGEPAGPQQRVAPARAGAARPGRSRRVGGIPDPREQVGGQLGGARGKRARPPRPAIPGSGRRAPSRPAGAGQPAPPALPRPPGPARPAGAPRCARTSAGSRTAPGGSPRAGTSAGLTRRSSTPAAAASWITPRKSSAGAPRTAASSATVKLGPRTAATGRIWRACPDNPDSLLVTTAISDSGMAGAEGGTERPVEARASSITYSGLPAAAAVAVRRPAPGSVPVTWRIKVTTDASSSGPSDSRSAWRVSQLRTRRSRSAASRVRRRSVGWRPAAAAAGPRPGRGGAAPAGWPGRPTAGHRRPARRGAPRTIRRPAPGSPR